MATKLTEISKTQAAERNRLRYVLTISICVASCSILAIAYFNI